MNPVTLYDGRVVDSSSVEWMMECEARMVLRMSHEERAEFFEGVRKKRKQAGLQALRLRCYELEPYYVLSLPTRAERQAYAQRVGRFFGEQHRLSLEAKVMALHEARKLANTSADSA